MAGQTLEQLLCGTILPAFKAMAYDGSQYLSFGQIAMGIELFGACRDAEPNLNKEGVSRSRFNLGLTEYMAKVDARYATYAGPRGTPFELYGNLRCGMAHLLRPKGDVGLTSRVGAAADGTNHLEIYAPLNKLVLVAEQWFDDFESAAQLFIADLPSMDQTKVGGVFLPVHDIAPAT